MRLIDTDALIADLEHDVAIDEDMLDYEEMTEDRREIVQFDKDCKQNAIDLLNHTPTIEPKKGRWIFIGDGYKCSECRSVYSWWADSQTSNYCPNCGADMRGETDGCDS